MKLQQENTQAQHIEREISIIDSLLRNEAFTLAVAESQRAAYYTGLGETAPSFLLPGEDTANVPVSRRVEKIATNLAGFYALECGLGALSAKSGRKPTDILRSIVANQAVSSEVLLLNRFANTTWKTGQPFRGLERIKRPTFRTASLLPPDAVRKDYDQIKAASGTLLTAMQDVLNESLKFQMETLRRLLHDELFAIRMATAQNAAYYTAQQKPAPPFLTPEEEKTTVMKPVKDQKIATNAAGFYALECGLNYLVTTQQKLPSDVLNAIVSDSIGREDSELLCRFANATWKASQPFRGLRRITRDTFTPFYFLSEADIDKDWRQVKAAAGTVLAVL
ncbi:hypothetical protein [Spirosoma sp.]|uniref:hypothetical protein n=1 Tax=Spirosoma sp. TaxID=1899569 RepID=UPI0026204A3D|nr:hypothetical protein [Spirosoma sp.]MCX6217872.1 hypothetical protein [Spirosoma sp.]